MKTFKTLPKLVVTTMLMNCTFITLTAQEYATANSNAVRPSNSFSLDTAFVGKNMRDNKMEIDLSELALKRSSNQEVKKLAQQMVTDHTQILNDLSKIAQNNNMLALPGYPTNGVASGTANEGNNTSGMNTTGNTNSTAGQSSGTNSTNNNNGNNNQNSSGSNSSDKGNSTKTASTNTGSYNNLGTTGTATTARSGAANSTNVNGQNQTTTSANNRNSRMKMQGMDAMQTASGAAFDKLWIPQMLGMHEAKLSELTSSIDTINDSDLKTAVNAAIPKIKMHRDMLSAMNSSKHK